MLSEPIIIAIIGGCFSLIGVCITTYKCCSKNKDDLSVPSPLLKKYPGTPTQILNQQYGPLGVSTGNYLSIENGKYALEMGPKVKMNNSYADGEINVFRVFNQYNNGYHMEAILSNCSGEIYLFVKRFDDKWKYTGDPSVQTIPAGNGKNILNIRSQIGMNNVTREQVGIMIKSDQSVNSVWGKCNIDDILLTHNVETII